MKFAVAVVVLTLAVAAQSSVIPLGWGGLGHGWAGAVDDGQWHGDGLWNGAHGWAGHGIAGPTLVQGHQVVGGWGGHGIAAHGPTLVQGHAVLGGWAGHGPVVDGHGHGHASYVAANRGSVHVAPLAGHIQSVSSSNTAPAPGTNW